MEIAILGRPMAMGLKHWDFTLLELNHETSRDLSWDQKNTEHGNFNKDTHDDFTHGKPQIHDLKTSDMGPYRDSGQRWVLQKTGSLVAG